MVVDQMRQLGLSHLIHALSMEMPRGTEVEVKMLATLAMWNLNQVMMETHHRCLYLLVGYGILERAAKGGVCSGSLTSLMRRASPIHVRPSRVES